jgi:hypothetical protein
MEELENLEETLNESIRESIGARSGRISRGKGKGTAEDGEDFSRYIILQNSLQTKNLELSSNKKIKMSYYDLFTLLSYCL